MDELLTVDEVANYLRVSRSTVWRWCQAKRVPAFKIGREWRISGPVLEELMAAQQKAAVDSESANGRPGISPSGERSEKGPEYPAAGTVGSGDGD